MARKDNRKWRVCAVMVTYNSDLQRLRKSVDSLAGQVDSIVAVDNGSRNLGEIRRIFAGKKATLVEAGRNLGLAKGLNTAVRRCMSGSTKPDWILTLDDDTIVHNGAVSEVLSRYGLLQEKAKKKVGIVTLSPKEHDSDPYTYSLTEDPAFQEKLFAQTSGNLVKSAIFGFARFREDLFIDHIDHEFDLQIRRRGFRILEYDRRRLDHSYGERNKALTKGINYYNERRLYYYTRNGTYIRLNYRGFPLTMYTLGILSMYSRFIRVNGAKGIPAAASIFFRSFADGLRGKLGENRAVSGMRLIR